MEGAREQSQLRHPAHPMPGLIAVVPLPDPDEATKSDESPVRRVQIPGVGAFVAIDFSGAARSPGIAAAIVVAIGPVGPGMSEELSVPYAEGATVYFGEQYGFKIDEYTYLPMDRVLAWEEAPERC